MTPLFKKLNLKDHKRIVVANAPDSFVPELEALEGVEILEGLASDIHTDFFIGFVVQAAQVEEIASYLASNVPGDGVMWLAYPKKSSKRYKSEINRDNGWAAVGAAGMEGVRLVSIDADWSALRFRRVEFIKSMKRNKKMIISEAGRKRVE